MSQALKSNSALQILDMSENLLDNESCDVLLQGVIANQSLKELSMARNMIDDPGAEALAMGKPEGLKMDFTENFISPESVGRIQRDAVNVTLNTQLIPFVVNP